MKPEVVREYLAAKSAGTEPAAPELKAARRSGAAPRSGPDAEDLYDSISSSYFLLRIGLAILALLFPIVLVIGAGHIELSLSAYYHYDGGESPPGGGTMRNFFVGVLCAVGAFLYLYKGYSWKENWALNLAGVTAIGVAFFPTDWPRGGASTAIGYAHYASAVTFFVAIAYVCVCRRRDTLPLLNDEERRRRFAGSYAVLATLMIVVPLSVFLIDRMRWLADGSPVITIIEATGIWVFATFWWVKTHEIRLIERQSRQGP